MDGENIGEKSGNEMSQNVDVVTSILQETQSPEIRKEEGVDSLVEELFGEIGVVVEKKANEAEQKGYMSRREFFKKVAIFAGATAVGLSGCAPKKEQSVNQSPVTEINPTVMPTEKPLEGTEKEYAERGYTLVEKPFKMNKQEFVLGDSGFRTAIAENFPFPSIDESGNKYILKYGKENETVSFFYFTGEKPPVTGEILPFIYRLPNKVKSLEVSPYAISIQANISKEIQITDTDECYLVPIVTSGSNTSIVPNTYEGKLVNSMYPEFKVKPDSVSQNESGYLSWALLRKDGNNLVMEGVVNNTSANIFVNYKDIPEEISDMYR